MIKELDFSGDPLAISPSKKDLVEISTYQSDFSGARLKYGNVTREYLLRIAGSTYKLAGETITLPSQQQVKEDLDNLLFYNAIYRDYTDSFETTLGEKFYEEISPEFKAYLATRRITLSYFYPKRADIRPRPQNMTIETPYLRTLLHVLGFDLNETFKLVLREGKTLAERSPDIIVRSTKFPSKGYITNIIVGRLRDDFKLKNIYSEDWYRSSEGILKVDPATTSLFDLSDVEFNIEEQENTVC